MTEYQEKCWNGQGGRKKYQKFRSVISVYEGAKTRVREHSELSEEFDIKVNIQQELVLQFTFSSCDRCYIIYLGVSCCKLMSPDE